MNQFSLYAVEHHGASALPGSPAHAVPGTRRYEKWARELRMLRVVGEHSAAARLERRRCRLQRRLAAVNERIEAQSPVIVAAAGC